jgi:hypothetical protein
MHSNNYNLSYAIFLFEKLKSVLNKVINFQVLNITKIVSLSLKLIKRLF